jgi:hypothetical protein
MSILTSQAPPAELRYFALSYVSNLLDNQFAHPDGGVLIKVLLVQRRRLYAILLHESFTTVQSCRRGTASKMATPIANILYLFLLVSLPFRLLFRSPRPPSIETGVREVPRTLSEHPEDL